MRSFAVCAAQDDNTAPVNQISFLPDFRSWQSAARAALQAEISPEQIAWQELNSAEPALPIFDENETAATRGRQFLVPKKFVELAKQVALHSDEQRWALLYRILWRVTHGEPKLLEVFVDADVARANDMAKSVRHDIHKMRAFEIGRAHV